jgi:hypothetical protein
MAKIHLSTRFVKEATCPQGKRKIEYFDTASKSLSLEVRESGGKTYYRRYRNARGRIRQIKLGGEQDLSLADARKMSEKIGRQIALGEDPLETKSAERAVPTFAEFIDAQYLPYVKAYKKSWQTDVSLLKNHLLPRFGRTYLDQITRQDIVKMHADRKDSGAAAGSANRLLIMMRYIFNLAIRWEVAGITTNPTKNVPLMPEHNKRERYLRHDEARSLYESV